MRHTRSIVVALALCAGAPSQDLFDVNTIRTIEVTAPLDWRAQMAANYASQTFISVDVRIDGVLYQNVGARHRGYSTYRFLPSNRTDKRPWKLSLDEYVPGQSHQGYNTLNINNNIWDPSFVREVAGYEYLRRYIPSPKCCYVKLVVNGEDLGLFCNTEQINKDFLEQWFPEDEGNRYRGDRASTSTPYSNSALTWLGTNLVSYQAAYQLKTENGVHPPWTDLINAINVLNNTPAAQLPTALPQVIDVDQALRFLAAANVSAWLDSYIGRTCKNFYLYEDLHHGRIAILPWDLNNGFGGLTDGLGTTGVARLDPFRYEFDAQNPRPLLSKIVQIPAWRGRYLAHYRTMLPDFAWSVMGPRIDALRTLIRPLLAADAKAIYTMAQFDANMTTAINVGFVTVPGIQPFFQDRNAFLATHADLRKVAPTLASLAHWPAAPTPTQGVTVTVAVSGAIATNVTLYYRTRGPYQEAPMYDDGLHGDGAANDGVYGGTIPPHAALSPIEYYVGANGDLAANGAMAFLPALAEFNPHGYRVRGAAPAGPIQLSEFMAKNDNGIRDEANELEDWIELVNVSAAPVGVSGMYLTDDVGNPTKWQIPAGYTLQPGQTLLVWADEDGLQGPLHANFKLSGGGEELALFAADGTTNLDWIEFGAQLSDVSTGRLLNTAPTEFTFPTSTPRQWNQPEPCGHLPYGAADPTAARFRFAGQGAPSIGQSTSYLATGAAPLSPGIVILGGGPLSFDLLTFGPLLVNPAPALILPIGTDAAGTATLPVAIPANQGLVGNVAYLQAFVVNGANGQLSNAVLTRFCQ